MAKDTLSRVMACYAAQCDGEWEHEYGINIITIDNPGCSVSIDLTGTNFHVEGGKLFSEGPHPKEEDEDWMVWGLSDDRTSFGGVGDPSKLEFILEKFLEAATKT